MGLSIAAARIKAGYNGALVLDGIDFALGTGEFAAIIGPNGCGKTTLLRCLSRSMHPMDGRVELDGKDIYEISSREYAKKVAVVPQETLFTFDFSVLDITLMGRSPRLGRFAVESGRDMEIALDALKRTGTAQLVDRTINSLSGGERQRVMIARALAQEPEVLLLDEPTSHLDITYQFEIMDLVRSLNRERGLTVLAVLHDLNLAAHYCDRLIMMGRTKVRASGTPEEVVTADNIKRVYGAEVWVRKHPTTHRPYVIAGIGKGKKTVYEDYEAQSPIVHIIGGGGTAAPIMARLARRGFTLTAGPLSEGDADKEVAEALDIDHIAQPLFSFVSGESHSRHIDIIDKADIVILTDVPVGHGNVLNVQAAAEALSHGKQVIIIKPGLMSERDFTNGQASGLIGEIMANGAVGVESIEDLIANVEERINKA